MATYADSFAGTAGSGLSGRTASGGWTWTLTGGTDLLTINASGKVNGAAGNVNTPRFYAIPAVGNNQFVEAKLTPSGAGYYLAVRINLTNKTGYILRLDTSAILLFRWDSLSTLVSLGSFGTATSSDTIKLEAVGSNLKVYKNGVQVGSTVVDANYGSGNAGLIHRTGLTLTDAYDDFNGGDVGGTTHNGASTFTGTGSLVLAAHIARQGASALAATSSLAASASIRRGAGAALSGTGTATAMAVRRIIAAAAISGSGTLAATASRATTGAAALAGTSALAVAATTILQASTALDGIGTLGATGTLSSGLSGAATLSGGGTVAATATVTRKGTAALQANGALTASLSAQRAGSAILAGAGALTVLARLELRAAAALSASGTLVAQTQDPTVPVAVPPERRAAVVMAARRQSVEPGGSRRVSIGGASRRA